MLNCEIIVLEDKLKMNVFIRARKRYCLRRMSVMSDQAQKFSENFTNNNLSSNSLQNVGENKNKQNQPKRDSRHTISDEEGTIEWIPEIPFFNVDITFFCKIKKKHFK